MAVISYQSGVLALECYPEYSGEQNVVFNVAWKMTGTDGVRVAEYRGKTSVPYNDGDFIPYNQLSEQQVLAWVDRYAAPGEMAAARALIDNNINAQSRPSTATPPLPWNG